MKDSPDKVRFRRPRVRKMATNVRRKDAYSIGETAILLGCGIQYARKLCNEGKLQSFRIPRMGNERYTSKGTRMDMPHRRVMADSVYAMMRELGIPIPPHLLVELNSIIFVGFSNADVLQITRIANIPKKIKVRAVPCSFTAGVAVKEEPPATIVVDISQIPEYKSWVPAISKYVEAHEIIAVCGADQNPKSMKQHGFSVALQTPVDWEKAAYIITGER